MSKFATVLILVLVPLLVENAAHAQINSGDRIRVTQIGGVFVVGYFESSDATALSLKTSPEATTTTIPMTRVTKVEVSRGVQRKTKEGALTGGLLGATVGLFLAAIAIGVGQNLDDESVTAPVLLAVVPTAVGVGVGALIGNHKTKEAWQRVPNDQLPSAAP
jgi:hypothetical protein